MDSMEPPVSKVCFPDMRLNMQAYTESLCDEEYQKRVWLEHQPSKRWDSFDDVVHFFFDDTTLSDNPEEYIGLVLLDSAEADAVRNLTASIDDLLDDLGTHLPDEDYIRAPGFAEIVARAKKLGALIGRPPRKPDEAG